MSIQLQIDEMLEFLCFVDSPRYWGLKADVEALANQLADEVAIQIPELTRNGLATFDGTAFGGTCAPFRPTAPGPCPDILEHFDIEVSEWEDMQEC